MSVSKLSPAVVIATRRSLVDSLGEFGSRPIPASLREQIADWLIGSGYLSETFYDLVAERFEIEEEA